MINKASISAPVPVQGMAPRRPAFTFTSALPDRPAPPLRSQSKFLEGSMNDRVSAAPPIDFLGPEENQEDRELRVARSFSFERPMMRPASEGSLAPQQQQKKGVLGGLWDGVRQRMFGKSSKSSRPTSMDSKAASEPARAQETGDIRPSRDEVLQNYHQLVSSGFFSSHAIKSTRQPPPPQRSVSSSSSSESFFAVPFSATSRPSTDQKQRGWPLPHSDPIPVRPSVDVAMSDVPAPVRGIKRGFVEDHEDDRGNTMKKLRKSASKVSSDLSLPKLRKQTSAQSGSSMPPPLTIPVHPNGILTRRSVSGSRESNRLAKLRPQSAKAPPVHLDPTTGERTALDGNSNLRVTNFSDLRLLPPRRPVKPLSVVPDANRGIPKVPEIPAQFKHFGEDRENERWRGLQSA